MFIFGRTLMPTGSTDLARWRVWCGCNKT